MRAFFKTFFAALLALIVFVFVIFMFLLGMVSGIARNLGSSNKPVIGEKAVLVVDLSQSFREQAQGTRLV